MISTLTRARRSNLSMLINRSTFLTKAFHAALLTGKLKLMLMLKPTQLRRLESLPAVPSFLPKSPTSPSLQVTFPNLINVVANLIVSAGLTASIDGTIDMQASASGTIDSGKIKLFEVGVPGLDFPGCAYSSLIISDNIFTPIFLES